MTTADERLRNWIWGRDMLAELAVDDALPSPIRFAASSLLQSYPDDVVLRSILAGQQLSDESSIVLSSVRQLFQRLLSQETISDQRRYSLQVILRHFD